MTYLLVLMILNSMMLGIVVCWLWDMDEQVKKNDKDLYAIKGQLIEIDNLLKCIAINTKPQPKEWATTNIKDENGCITFIRK